MSVQDNPATDRIDELELIELRGGYAFFKKSGLPVGNIISIAFTGGPEDEEDRAYFEQISNEEYREAITHHNWLKKYYCYEIEDILYYREQDGKATRYKKLNTDETLSPKGT